MTTMHEAIQSAIRTFKPGPKNLTQREWDDAVAKLEAAIVQPPRCEASPVGGYSAGWQCDLASGHGSKHMALVNWQDRLPDGSLSDTGVPINWEQE